MKEILNRIKCFFGRHEDETLRQFHPTVQQVKCVNCRGLFLTDTEEGLRFEWTKHFQMIFASLFPDKFI